MKRAVVVLCALITVFAGLLSHQLGHIRAGSDVPSDISDTSDTGYEYYDGEGLNNEDTAMETSRPKEASPLIKVDTREDSITVLVNREYRMSADYIPADLVVPEVRFSFYGTYEKSYVRQVTADALKKLFEAGERENVILKVVSGYRSYARQKAIYDSNVSKRGARETNKVSAKPGASEHQTGLTVDVSSDAVGCALEERFGETPDGKWLAANCYKYGFIIRYPKHKSGITGYSYEPWHIRYVGRRLATHLYKRGITLEEYYQTTTVDEQIKEPQGKIHDIAEDDKNEPQMTAAPTPKPNHKITSTRPTAVPTKAPAAYQPRKTAKPKPTKKPGAAKSTPKPKPSVQTPAPSNGDAESSQTPSNPDGGTGTAPTDDGSVETTQEDSATQPGNVDEEIDIGVK